MKKWREKYDVVIVGCGVAGLFTALHLPKTMQVLVICKETLAECDSMLAQGGICVCLDEADYESYFEDTMRAGHNACNAASVDMMIRESQAIIQELLAFGVAFDRNPDGSLHYTKEGAHSVARICHYQDITGKEMTEVLQSAIQKLENVTVFEHTTMIDLQIEADACVGIWVQLQDGTTRAIAAQKTVLATGGIGGLYEHSTNFPSLTGDSLRLAEKYNIELADMDYVQIHPTTLYTKEKGRRFLITESARGEGALLYNARKERFVDELLPRDQVTQAILAEMEKDGRSFVWLSFEKLSAEKIKTHFPNIYARCLSEGYDLTKEAIPVVPAQHYFMGGIAVDLNGQTSLANLYAVGETSCNGVHGKNRLASNSLLESLVFARRAAQQIAQTQKIKERVF